jgi:hypothetical protein
VAIHYSPDVHSTDAGEFNVKHDRLMIYIILVIGFFHALCLPAFADTATERYICSFVGHTPAGTLTGSCTTQSQPALGYIARWKFTLTFDRQSSAAAATLKPDQFYDMLRGQCLEDGGFTTILPLWGDFLVKPEAPDYISGNIACAPRYQVAPSFITISQISSEPVAVELLIEERPADYDETLGLPTPEWFAHYLDSFQRLQVNPVFTRAQSLVSPR